MLTDVFGNSKQLKVLDYLIDNQDLDYSKSDIAEGAVISRTTLNKILDELLQTRVVIKTRKIGNARMFRLNEENPVVIELLQFDKRLHRVSAGLEADGP